MSNGRPAPIVDHLHRDAQEFEPAMVDEIQRAVRPSARDLHWDRIDDKPQAILQIAR